MSSLRMRLASTITGAIILLTTMAPDAPGSDAITVAADVAAPAVGQQVTITITLTSASGFSVWGQALQWDPTRLSLTDASTANAALPSPFGTVILDARSLADIAASGEVRTGGYFAASAPSYPNNTPASGPLARFNFTRIAPGSTTLTCPSKGGDFGSVLIDASGNERSPPSATLALTDPVGQTSPVILMSPQSQSVAAGQAATFTATASGNPAPMLQWLSAPAGGSFTPIAGATAGSYTTPAATLGQSGMLFEVVATNSVGNATSSVATLMVTAAALAPTITSQPLDVSVAPGQTATFTVAVTGSAPLTYQWNHGGAAVGSGESSLTLTNVQPGDAGSYTCVVSNSAGSATSSAATLSVTSASLDPLIVAAARFDDGAGAWNGGGNSADKAFDGDTTTYYDCATTNGGYTGIDVGTGATATVTAIRYWARSGFPGRMTGGIFEGSNAQTTGYTTLATVTASSDAAWTTIAVASASPYRYLRYRGPDGGNCNVAEIEFHGTARTGGGSPGQAPAITSIAPLTAIAGQPYSYAVIATGAPVPTLSLGAAPDGMSIDPLTRVIRWTPQAEGAAHVTVRAVNGSPPDAVQDFTIAVSTSGTGTGGSSTGPGTTGGGVSSSGCGFGMGASALVLFALFGLRFHSRRR